MQTSGAPESTARDQSRCQSTYKGGEMSQFKMYFNTGVTPANRPYDSLCEHQEWKDGTMQIAFYLESEPPKGSRLLHLW